MLFRMTTIFYAKTRYLFANRFSAHRFWRHTNRKKEHSHAVCFSPSHRTTQWSEYRICHSENEIQPDYTVAFTGIRENSFVREFNDEQSKVSHCPWMGDIFSVRNIDVMCTSDLSVLPCSLSLTLSIPLSLSRCLSFCISLALCIFLQWDLYTRERHTQTVFPFSRMRITQCVARWI